MRRSLTLIHLAGLLLAARALVTWGAAAAPPADAPGPAPSLALGLAGGSALLLAVAAVRRWQGAAVPRPALSLRLAFVWLVAMAATYLVWLQPFDRARLELVAACAFGGFAACELLGPPLASRLPARPRAVLDWLVFNLCLAAVLAEVGFRVYGVLRPSPLFAQTASEALSRIEAGRYPAGQVRFGFPCNSGGHYDTGFRTRRDDEVLVCAIGDSFSSGIVPHPFHFTTVCEDELGGVPVYNVGLPGTGPAAYEHLLRYEVMPLDPTVVVINFFVGNDFMDATKAPPRDQALRRWLDRDNLLLWQVPRRLAAVERDLAAGGQAGLTAGRLSRRICSTLEEYRAEFPWVDDYRLEPEFFSQVSFHQVETRRVIETCNPRALAMEAAGAALRRLQDAAGETPLLVMIIPDVFQVEDRVWEAVLADLPPHPFERDLAQRTLIRWLEEQGLPYLDLLPVLRAVPPEEDGDRHLFHRHNTHLGVRGNAVVGRALAEFLRPYL